MKKLIVFTLLLALVLSANSQKSLAERLGYEKDAKLLIMHADDIGVAHSVNAATIEAFQKSGISSASIMVPCPWFPEIAALSKENPTFDFGLHLTLTAEWQYYKWGGVLPSTQIPSLLNKQGYFYDNTPEVLKNAKLSEVEAELRAQVQRAIDFGIQPTHLDSHMGVLFQSPEFFRIYQKVGKEFGIPVMIPSAGLFEMPEELQDPYFITLDQLYSLNTLDESLNYKAFYSDIIRNLKPGLNEILIHLAYDDAETQAMTINHPDFGAAWRQRDLNYVLSDEFKNLLKENQIKLVTYREVQRLLKK